MGRLDTTAPDLVEALNAMFVNPTLFPVRWYTELWDSCEEVSFFLCAAEAGVIDRMSRRMLSVRAMCMCWREGKGLRAESSTRTKPRIESPTYT